MRIKYKSIQEQLWDFVETIKSDDVIAYLIFSSKELSQLEDELDSSDENSVCITESHLAYDNSWVLVYRKSDGERFQFDIKEEL